MKIDQVDELNIINRMATILSKSLDLETVLESALNETMRALKVNNGGIYLFNPDNKKLILRLNYNLTDAFIKNKSVVGPGEGCTGTAYVTKKIFSGYGTPEKEFICLDAKSLMGIDCLAAAPIIFKDEVIGVLELFAPVDRKLSKSEINLLETICNHIGVAVANANSHHALQRALKNSRLLLEASEAIVSSLKLSEILQRLIYLISELTHISRAAIWFYEPAANVIKLAHDFENLQAGFKINLREKNPFRRVVMENRARVIKEFDQASTDLRRITEELSIKTLLVVPISIHGRVLGLLTLDKPGVDYVFSQEEIDMSNGIARQAAIAIENAQVFEAQHVIADTLQRSFLPIELPKSRSVEVGVAYKSASVGALVGGDFYDFINMPGKLAFIIGDVSGKGIEAATLTGVVKNTVRAFVFQGLNIDEVLNKTNDLITKQIEKNQFVTLFLGLLDVKTGNLEYCNAGHPAALLGQSDKDEMAVHLSGENPPIGIFSGRKFKARTVKMQAGDTLLIYTDGVIEARHDKKLFGEERLEKFFLKHRQIPVQDIAVKLLAKVDRFNRRQLKDDIALVVFRFKGKS